MKRQKRPPTRTCVVCRTARDKKDLLRVVRTGEGEVGFDRTGRLAGRGAYVCASRECIAAGLGKGKLAAALKTGIDTETCEGLESELYGACAGS
jgi:hypothetical protein